MWKQTESDFNLERHLIVFLQENSFYAEISRQLKKISTHDMPTAAVSYNAEMDELALWYNPKFFKTLTNWNVRGVLTHEFNHIIFGHLTARRRTPHKYWNIATDLAINSIIMKDAKFRPEGDDEDSRPLPDCALIPGRRPAWVQGPGDPNAPDWIGPLCDLIEGFPSEMSSEYYFEEIMKILPEEEKNDNKDGDSSMGGKPEGGFDDHSGWDNIPDDMREYVESKVKAIVSNAVKAADSQSGGWGNISASMQAEIRNSITTTIDWRGVLRQFVGTINRAERCTSIKRINRRYPYVNPGVKRNYTARLCIAIDQSGSVDDAQLETFFSELASLTKRVTVDIMPFDTMVDESKIFEWKKRTMPKLSRVSCGGTDFNAPTNYVNNAKNRGRWDGLIIMTDGEAPRPVTSRVKRGWVLSKNHKLLFTTTELQVFVEDKKPMKGAWR